jgi:hypothetical protein
VAVVKLFSPHRGGTNNNKQTANLSLSFSRPPRKTLKLCWNMIYFFIHKRMRIPLASASCLGEMFEREINNWICERYFLFIHRRRDDVLLLDRNCRIIVRLVIAEFLSFTFCFPSLHHVNTKWLQLSFCANFFRSNNKKKNFPLTGEQASLSLTPKKFLFCFANKSRVGVEVSPSFAVRLERRLMMVICWFRLDC